MCQPWHVTDGSRKAIIAAFFANLGIAIAKFVGFLITRSAGMLAESVHSLADTGNQGLLLLGGKRAERDATPQHPFGYGRERYFWAFAVALVLFSMGGLFALYEGIEKFRHPHEVDKVGVAVAILVFGLAIGWVAQLLLGQGTRPNGASLFAGLWAFGTLREPGLFGRQFRELRLGTLVAWIAVAALLASLVTQWASGRAWPPADDVLFVLAGAFLLQALAVVHGLRAAKAVGPATVAVAYIALLLVPMALVGFGLADSWVRFRERFGQRPAPPQG